MPPIEKLSVEEKLIILESMIRILGLSRTEKEMLIYCKKLIEEKENIEDDKT